MKKYLFGMALLGMAYSANAEEIPFSNLSNSEQCAVGATYSDKGETYFGYGKERGKTPIIVMGNETWPVREGDPLGVLVIENGEGETLTWNEGITRDGGFIVAFNTKDIRTLLDNRAGMLIVRHNGVELARLALTSSPSGRGLTYFFDCLAFRDEL